VHLGDGITRRGVHPVRGPELLRELELAGQHVHRDHAGRPGDGGAVHGREAHAPTADHRHRAPDLDPRRVEHRSEARRHPAADQGGPVEGHVLAYLHERVLVHEHLLRVGGEVQELMHHLAVLRQTRRLPGLTTGLPLAAQRRPATEAVLAVAAEDREAGDDMVTRLDVAHLGADLLHDPGRLVPEHGRHGVEVGAGLEVEVAVTDAGCRRADQYLPGPGLVDLDVLDLERLPDLTQDRGLHGVLLPSAGPGLVPRKTVPLGCAPRQPTQKACKRRRRAQRGGAERSCGACGLCPQANPQIAQNGGSVKKAASCSCWSRASW
jgi:hypothetical protein